jgi:hypothetical protein
MEDYSYFSTFFQKKNGQIGITIKLITTFEENQKLNVIDVNRWISHLEL